MLIMAQTVQNWHILNPTHPKLVVFPYARMDPPVSWFQAGNPEFSKSCLHSISVYEHTHTTSTTAVLLNWNSVMPSSCHLGVGTDSKHTVSSLSFGPGA